MKNPENAKGALLNKIISKYLNSRDFNGLPVYHEIELCKQLLLEDKIKLYSDAFVPNTHIKSRPLNNELKTTEYLKEIDKSRHVVFPLC